MKKRMRLKGLLTGACITVLVLGLAIPAVAKSSNRTVQAVYNNIKLIINGKTVVTKDKNGKQLQPVLIDGVAYIPAQSVSDALKTKLTWNSSTKTVTLTSKAGSIAPDESGFIGLEKAKSIALKHAGVKAAEVTYFKAELDWDDGRAEYEIEFFSNNVEYDYSIDPKSGSIRDWDHEADGYRIPKQNNDGASKKKITLEQAKSLAKAKAPNAVLVSCKLDIDDGKYIYEGELRDGRKEYDFEIDAVSGKFLKWEVDIDD